MSKDEEIRNVGVRRKNILFLMQRYLQDNGFYSTAEALRAETRLPETEFELCDNVDLDGMYLEYASYYHLKFGKYPRILRKAKQPVKVELAGKRKKTTAKPGQTSAAGAAAQTNAQQGTAGTVVEVTPAEPVLDAAKDLQVTVKRMTTVDCGGGGGDEPSPLSRLQGIEHGGALGAGGNELLSMQDWQMLGDLVKTTILREEPKLSWSDMCGNAHAIEIVKEAVLAPLKFPQLFAQGLRPWKSVLLHGPPGSGKTLLAKILYAETRNLVTFFNVTASVIVSKWRGESEKILRILFHMARQHAPSIIFLDEIEGLTSRRDRSSDHESSKRFKNELLQLLDGMEQQPNGVFILASTNLPWDIDDAFLRRFEKKILVQLPNEIERAMLIGKLMPVTVNMTKEQMELLVRMSEHFTGDEIRLACKEIAMQTVRRVTKGKEVPEITLDYAFEQVKPLSVKLMHRHLQWQQEHGS